VCDRVFQLGQRAAVYCRVSTADQSYARQERDLAAFAERAGYEAPDDATSARFALRLGMLGYVRTTTLKAFPEAAYREIIAHLGG